MIAVIMAAGKGSRLSSLTKGFHKSLLHVNDKPLLFHAIDSLPNAISKIVLVVNQDEKLILKLLKERVFDKSICIVKQFVEYPGTMGTIYSARDFIDSDFLLISSDNIYSPNDFNRCLLSGINSVLFRRINRKYKQKLYPECHDSILITTLESQSFKSNCLLNTGCYYLSKMFSNWKPIKSPSATEYGIPENLIAYCNNSEIKLKPVFSRFWFPINSPVEYEIACRESSKKYRLGKLV